MTSGIIILTLALFGYTVYIICKIICEAERKAENERRIRALQLSDADNMPGLDFEHYVCRLLKHRGLAAEVTSGSNDFGVDIVSHSGTTKYAIQVKRYANKVSRTAISDAVAGSVHYGCNRAMVITNSYFTKGAKEFANSTSCELVDRDILAEWIIDYQGAVPATDETAPIEENSKHPMQQQHTNEQSQGDDSPRDSDNPSIPPEVLNSIKQKAAAEYPNDYSTQVYILEEETEAYLKLQSYDNPNIPPKILNSIKQKAAAAHPDDYSTQVYVLEEEIEAYLKLQSYETSPTR